MKNTQMSMMTAPEMHITSNKNRIKRYESNNSTSTYYLRDKQEFQMELYNPTTDIVKAEIWLNGKKLSGGGIVLKPAERIFLDRYLDSPQKFLFETYEVGTTDNDKKATHYNGQVKVSFFKEKETSNPTLLLDTSPIWNSGNTVYYSNQNSSGNTTNISTFTTTSNTSGFNIPSFTSGQSYDFTNKISSVEPKTMKCSAKKVETGMVGRGDTSTQEFKNVQYDFEYSPIHTVEYKILPVSLKQTTSRTLNVRQYCEKCGSKIKKSFKFCTNCGNKL